MTSRTVHTNAGPIRFREASEELVYRLRERSPMGLVELPTSAPTPYGIVFQRGDLEVEGVTFRQAQQPQAEALDCFCGRCRGCGWGVGGSERRCRQSARVRDVRWRVRHR